MNPPKATTFHRITAIAVFTFCVACGSDPATPSRQDASGDAPDSGRAADAQDVSDAVSTNRQDASGDAPDSGQPADAADVMPDMQQAAPSVRVIRGDPVQTTWWDFTLRGGSLDLYEGAWVTVLIGMPERPPERLASAKVQITKGEFSLEFRQVWEAGLYKRKAVWIDVDGNGACNYPEDRVFLDSRAQFAPELYVGDAGPSTARVPLHSGTTTDNDSCDPFNKPWPVQ